MAPKVLKTTQAGLAALAASTLPFAGAASAEDAQNSVAANSLSSAEFNEIVARNDIIREAAAHPANCPGEIGVSILMGSDTGDTSVEFYSSNLKSGFKKHFGLNVAVFSGENAPDKPTEFTYSFAGEDNEGKFDILTLGPYNAEEVIEQAPNVAGMVKSIAVFDNISVSYDCEN